MKTFYRPVDCQSRAAMIDFLENHFRYYTTSGYKGTDENVDFSLWSMDELRKRVRLVQDLDRLADGMVQEAAFFAQNYTVQDEEYQVTRTRKVLIPVG